MTYQKTVGELVDRLDANQYVAIGSGTKKRKRGEPTGSGFYFIGKVGQYRKDIDGLNAYFRKQADKPEDYVPLEDRIITDIKQRLLPGEPPMLSVLAAGLETGRCWVLSDYDKSAKQKPPKILGLNELHSLRLAITDRAVTDYIDRVRDGEDTKALDLFFESDWGELITGADGKKVEEVCRLKAKYSLWRDAQGCAKCKLDRCAHFRGTNFTAIEHGTPKCLKEAEDESND